MTNIVTCIDGSSIANAVCDAGIWASQRTGAPLKMLHVLEKGEQQSRSNLSGNILPEGRRKLLRELVGLEEKYSKLALEDGKHMLEDARNRASEQGIEHISTMQRHGKLSETLTEMDDEIRLLVIGHHGEDHQGKKIAIGSQLESVIRTSRKPILIAPEKFEVPRRFMIAYDGRDVTEKAIEGLVKSPLLKDLACHIVSVNNNSTDRQPALAAAAAKLTDAGFGVTAQVIEGSVQNALRLYGNENRIELLVMGAYGHSRLHQLFVGSHTTNMISRSDIPVLIAK
ncbi:MAG: universal stress protein [Pseudomonadales bacterium]|jgi:nucleotide-binding universal stress UspA family protein|nr:universal stress protein [Pseudomonadales bacterium]